MAVNMTLQEARDLIRAGRWGLIHKTVYPPWLHVLSLSKDRVLTLGKRRAYPRLAGVRLERDVVLVHRVGLVTLVAAAPETRSQERRTARPGWFIVFHGGKWDGYEMRIPRFLFNRLSRELRARNKAIALRRQNARLS